MVYFSVSGVNVEGSGTGNVSAEAKASWPLQLKTLVSSDYAERP